MPFLGAVDRHAALVEIYARDAAPVSATSIAAALR